MATLKFNGNASTFYTDLKARVDAYFLEHKIDPVGNAKLYVKSAFYVTSFIATYIMLVFFTPSAPFAILLSIMLGLFSAGIGFNVMHDGGHGSYSSSKTMNRIAALTLNLLGGSSFMWNIKHNMLHHTWTNIEGHDDDIAAEPFLRLAPSQKKRFYHRFQHIYFFLIYGMTYVLWIYILDIGKYFRKTIASKENIHLDLKTHIGFWLTKIIYLGIFAVIPIIRLGWVDFFIGYGIFVVTTGIVISIIFQLAHTVEDTSFVDPIATPVLENDWAVHQILTTSNFGSRSKLLSFLTGGLNQQVEHHLFPKISHVHYPELSPIVKATCADHGLVYLEQPTFFAAVVSHIKYLYRMGRE
ncbi:MAG: acyl-CoA desaturase [Bacteroidetes bacterium]|nr:acyl-CoA desaturase [Bacteroidota bacterium]